MTAQAPDPRAFSTWEDAFQHPVPIVRKLEQQLRNNIDENRQKLRSLVGASYRDLLGTAERIIEMDEQMQTTEIHLGDIGRKCNARAVERVSGNYEKMRRAKDERGREQAGVVAQTKVLQNALKIVARTIKNGGDALLAAKLWVLARLLGKSVSESPHPPAILEDFRRRVVTLRKSLLAYIDRALVRTATDKAALAQASCAYALVTNSTPKDVLRHFLQTRYVQLNAKAEAHAEKEVLQMLDLYSQTLSDTRSLFPKLFADGMSRLGSSPLLKDPQVSSLVGLNLDVYGIWIAEDLRSFTPWVRHDQLLSDDVGDGLASWARQAQQSLVQAIRDCLRGETDATAVLGIRRSVLSRYLTLSSKMQSETHLQAIHDMRKVFLDRLVELAGETAADVEITFDVAQPSPPASPQAGGRDNWRLATTDVELSNGALAFRSSVLRGYHGRDDVVQANCEKLDGWTKNLDHLWTVVDQMRATRWDDDLDFELEDQEHGDLRNVFSKQDPDQLQTSLRDATTSSLQRLYASIEPSSVLPATAIRLLREIDQRRHLLSDRVSVAGELFPTAELVAGLHTRLAEAIIEHPLQQYVSSSQRPSRIMTELWDGSPPLPVQPTVKTYKLLVSLHRAMSAVGNDLWSPAAVVALQSAFDRGLAAAIERLLSAAPREPTANEAAMDTPGTTSETSELTDMNRDEHVQGLFDVLYLQRVLSADPDQHQLPGLADQLRAAANVDERAGERLRKNANEYWKRTHLLFGLLARHTTS